MKRLVRIALIAIAVAALLVVGSIAALLALLDDDDYRRLASYLVERETGRTMIVDGRFAVRASLEPSLVMSKVRITNPPWASGPDLAQIDHLELQIALRPLLSGTLVVERLVLNDARFALERSADGATNWTMGGDGPGLGLVPVFGAVRLRNVDWQYRDDASGEATSLTLAHLTVEDTGGAAQLEAQGVWDGEPITAQGRFGTLAEALRPTEPFPLDVSASLPGLDLSARGTIAEPAAGRGLDLRLVGHSDDVSQFLERLGSEAPLSGPLEGGATLGGDFDAVKIADLRLSVGDGSSSGKGPALQISGAIETVRAGGAPLLDGIALAIQGTTSTAVLADWLGRELPDLGAVRGQLTLSGTSTALSITKMNLQAGAEERLATGATGAIKEIRLTPAFSVAGADLQLTAAAHDLAALGTVAGVSLPAGAFSYRGQLSGDPDNWSLAGDGRLGDTALTQTFTGALASMPPRLSGELSLSLAGLELTGKGTMADPASGQGLNLHLVGHADDVAPLVSVLGHKVPPGRLAAEATIDGDLEALQVSDLQLSLAPAGSPGSTPALQAKGKIASVTPSGATLLGGIALEVQGATSSAVLSGWLGRQLPDLGPLGGQFTLSGTSEALKVEALKLQFGAADRLTITATGGVGEIRLAPILAVRGAELQLDAEAPDPSIIGAMLDVPVPTMGALSYTGQLSGDLDSWKLAGKAQVGRTVIEEDLAGSLQDARPRISGNLSVPALHLADFGIASDGAPERASQEDGAPEIEAAARGFASSLAPLRALDDLNLALNIEIGQVEGTKLSIGRGKLDLTLEDGIARIDPATFDFVAGTALVHLTVNVRAEPPQVDLSLHADDIQLGEFLAAMGGSAPMTGELALILKLKSEGDSARQMMSSLGGEADVAIQRGDVDVKDLNLATADLMTWLLAGADRGTGLLGGTTAGGRTKLECFVARFAIEDGIASAQSLLMKTPLTVSTAKGTIDLVNRTVDLHVHLKPREALLSSARAYRVQGPIADPTVDFSKMGFAAHAIEGLVLTPFDMLGSLFPLVDDDGKDKDNPCLH